MPLLDHEVMEYAASIPASYKLRQGKDKYIFKKAVEGLVPAEILQRVKMGFSVPMTRWFQGDLKEMFEDRVFATDAFLSDLFDPDPIRHWWTQYQRGIRDYSSHLWALLVLECWGRRFMR